jgi:hypothetical protein
MEIIDERGKINLSKWFKKVKNSNGFIRWAIGVLGISACIAQMYSLTWARVSQR